MTFFCRNTNLDITYTGFVQNLLYFRFVFVCYLNDNTWVFSKQNLDDIIALNFVEVDFHTTFCVSETHFK